MTTNLLFMLGIVAVATLGYVILVAVRAYFRFYGPRLVTCPETKQTAAVSLDAARAARDSVLGMANFRLNDCSRWPGRKDCDQDCVRQIERAPENCLVRNIVGNWYAGRECAYCHKHFESVDDIFHHRPALMGADGKTVEWDEIQPEKLPEVFGSALPVCWSCHMIESFRQEHPELVVDNPWQNRQGEWVHGETGTTPEERKIA